jgi:hypothetical protein
MRRSAELEELLKPQINAPPCDSSERVFATHTMCSICFEHAHSIRLLISAGNFTSAVTLMRLQYEAIVRAVWLLYAASDTAVSKMTTELTPQSEKHANRLPMLSEMLRQIQDSAPQQAVEMLQEFKDAYWTSISSFVHGGIHAINRHGKGYPLHLIVEIIQSSNGLTTMAGMLLAILTGNAGIANNMNKIQLEFQDCLPTLGDSPAT